ncbi:unnamed protein product [Didymodactylos carnosus]|uniref:HAT C-terminal dimerisation domain-containing protein n=1 Tax=Didymodactylos carnosus TaxID=1234261 RepID=A0A815P995_9BILA|nr:unnamed protein product [Didymodactylos carnosus]CAF1446025.1 unnamed protein product [Didymodactylos carnosus]CAF3705269.1 unnamed protein product [Didymodactylos carnosus]CAF4320654.1 unnamed protein product [Didymodactylos carnosus]
MENDNKTHLVQVNLPKKQVKVTPGSSGDVATGATVGAMVGVAVAGPPGAAAGAAVGAVTGYIFGTGNGVKRDLIGIVEQATETAIGIKNTLKDVLTKNDVDLKKIVSLGADNISVNYGCNHSVYVLLKEEIPNLRKAKRVQAIDDYFNFAQQEKKVDGVDLDLLFTDYNEILSPFKIIKRSDRSLSDLIKHFINRSIKTRETDDLLVIHKGEDKEEENTNNEKHEKNAASEELERKEIENEHIRPDLLWAYLFSQTSSPRPQMKKLISLIFSIPASNAFAETIFSHMNYC